MKPGSNQKNTLAGVRQAGVARTHDEIPQTVRRRLVALKNERVRRDQNLRENMLNSMVEGSAFSLMVGLGETYLPAFVLLMGLGELFSGLISTLPILAGSILQLFSPFGIRYFQSYRKWVIVCAFVQGVTFIPLVTSAFLGTLSPWLAFLSASIYWATGMSTGPAWNSWIGTLIPRKIQTSFFTVRSRWTQITTLIGFLIGGALLHWMDFNLPKSYVFGLLFTGAFVFRMVSVIMFLRQSEPFPPNKKQIQIVWPWEFLTQIQTRSSLGRFLLYALSVQFGVQIAAPYFTPYMLSHLNFTYSEYAILMAMSLVAKILVLPALGTVAKHHGTRALLWIGGVGLSGLPALWLVSSNFYYLLILQLFAGTVWAAFDLATLLLMFEMIEPHDRAGLFTSYNLCNAFSIALASVLGGFVLSYAGHGFYAYILVFGLSTVFRGLALFQLRGMSSHSLGVIPMAFRTLGIRPSIGFIGMPSLTSFRFWRGKKKED